MNAFAGNRFRVSFTRASNAEAGCSASGSETYIVSGSGSVELWGDAASLVDRLGGVSSRCSYVVSWSSVTGLALLAGATATVSATDSEVSARYYNVFSPGVVFSLPSPGSSFSDAGFTVTYARLVGSNDGCTVSVSESYDVNASGVVALSGNAASLVDRIGGVEAACYYSVEFSDDSDGLRLKGVRSFMVGSASDDITVSYVSVFSPGIAISVPNVDADGNGEKDFSGVDFTVGYAKTPGSDEGCSGSAAEVFSGQDNGDVDPPSERARLIDRIPGVSGVCSYFVTVVEENDNLEADSFVWSSRMIAMV